MKILIEKNILIEKKNIVIWVDITPSCLAIIFNVGRFHIPPLINYETCRHDIPPTLCNKNDINIAGDSIARQFYQFL